ncbi:helix-turn-helix transcriptional regulator [Dictyobacter arantiisoli]|uniref:histidine kinase n=1 Tax=Dictyobacter arantiisoli TaxID=2014874 RepID=A0A5A5TGH7_9CHLR|nr:LuxR C-terminal-related transcriptional regulator [Dictyobacter arantiisoli]GCF10432.1 hypothetical protein KDI_39960 [Dictyobacter arantiisoli]
MEQANRSIDASSSILPTAPTNSTLPEVMYSLMSLTSLTDLYASGVATGGELDYQELRQHILTHLRQVIQGRGACLLLYHEAQHHFIPVTQQGDRFAWGLLANGLDGCEIARIAHQGPVAPLDIRQIEQHTVILVTLYCQQTLLGLVALLCQGHEPLLDARGLLLTYMGHVASQMLYNHHQRSNERHQWLEQERNRIARDLHDSVVQQIAFTLYKLEFIQRLLEQDQTQAATLETRRAATSLDESLQELRISIQGLRPSQLSQQSLSDALADLLRFYQNANPQLIIQQDLPALTQLPTHLETPIFRLLQEALANIHKHAHATEIRLHLYLQNNLFVIEIRDNGIGITPQQLQDVEKAQFHPAATVSPSSHMGLQTMRERVLEAGGNWQIQSQTGKETCIKASFPLSSANNNLTAREKEILHLIVEGFTNRAIAQKLAISNDTVKTHIHHVIQKLHVKDRAEAAVAAVAQGWI